MFTGSLISDKRGTVAVIGALSLVGVVGMGAFAVDLNRGYDQQAANQRVADMAALASALAYKADSNAAVLNPTATDISKLHGLDGATVSAVLVENYPAANDKAVKVTIEMPVPFALARALGFSGSYTVGAISYAALSGNTAPTVPACILGLASSGNAISTTGGATIDTPDCAVAGVGDVRNGGTRINARNIISGSGSVINDYGTLSADSLRYAVNFTNPAWNTNVPASDRRVRANTPIVDPLADSVDLAAARAQLGNFTAPTAIGDPTTASGTNWDFNWSPGSPVAAYREGTSGKYTVPAGNYTIGRLTVGGGIEVVFQPGSTITIAGGLSNGGSKLTFGDADIRINGGFNSGSSGVTFGNGDLHIGSGSVSFSGTNRIGNGNIRINADVSIGGGSNLTLGTGGHAFRRLDISGGGWVKAGDGYVTLVNGISVGGGSTFAAGNGEYRIGPNGSSIAINLSGSAVMLMGDGLFSANGSITTQGGSRIVFGKTTNHYINGSMRIAGSALFGTSRYTINGDFTNGTGGTTWPYSSPVTGATYGNTLEGVSVSGFDLAGINVTFVLNGTLNLGGGAKTKLIANSASVQGGAIADVLLHSLSSQPTNWGAGAQSVFVGAVHLPNSDVTMSGGTTTLSAGQCFMLIANRIAATGGAAAGSACLNLPGNASGGSNSGGGSIRLIG